MGPSDTIFHDTHSDVPQESQPDSSLERHREVFLSYASANKPVADAACQTLEAHGIPCWIAPRNITPAQDWSEAIIDAIADCRVFVLLLSSASNLSEQVKREVQNAVGEGKFLLPVRIEEVSLSKHMRYFIGTPHWLDALTPPLSGHLERLAVTVRGLLDSRDSQGSAETAESVEAGLTQSTGPAGVFPVRPLNAPSLPNNLPQQISSFIGREKEVAEVTALLGRTRLLTLTGMGGTGKTRLALQVAGNLLLGEGNGVWLVELAPLADPALVPQAVMGALGVHEEAGVPKSKTLTEALKERRLLLVLDNCEHVLNACASLASDLLHACPQVRVLASSREALGIAGEQTFRVPSLSLPDPKKPQTGAAVAEYEAVRLFAERARQVQPSFAVTDENASAVAAICRQLDGIPLALELAAARVRSLAVEEIHARLGSRFRLLTGGSRTALPRQQTLRALIDWSYDLLLDPEKVVLARLSVFAGGWDLEAAEAVCAGEEAGGVGVEDWEVLDLVTALADKSLLVVEQREERMRYRLLESVRQYAAERLLEAGGGAGARGRHRDYFLALAEKADLQTRGPEQGVWLDHLEAEHDNLRAALDWCGEEEAEAQAGLRLAKAMYRFWRVRGYLAEGRARLATATGHPEAREYPLERASALRVASGLEQVQGNLAAARDLAEEALALFESTEDARGGAGVLLTLGNVALMQGDFAGARAYYERGLPLYRRFGEQDGVARALGNLGAVMQAQGDLAGAATVCEESLAFFRDKGDAENMARALGSLGEIAYARGADSEAQARLEEALTLFQQIGARNGSRVGSLCLLGTVALRQGRSAVARTQMTEGLRLAGEIGDGWGGADALEAWAKLCLVEGQAARAARLLGAASQARRTRGLPKDAASRALLEGDVLAVKTALEAAAFDAAWAEGEALTWEQAVGRALADG